MSSAKKCDRCGVFYEQDYDCSAINQNWWRYDVTKDAHPYGSIKLDLCNECKKSLERWLKNDAKRT